MARIVKLPGGLPFELTAEASGRAVYAKGFTVLVATANSHVNTVEYFRIHVSLWDGRPDFGFTGRAH